VSTRAFTLAIFACFFAACEWQWFLSLAITAGSPSLLASRPAGTGFTPIRSLAV